MNDLRSAYDDSDSTISNNLSTLNSLSDRYDELSKGLDAYGRNVSLSADEYKEYKDIVQQVLEISPSLITGYDEEGNAISNKNDLIRESIALMQEEQKQKAIDQVFNEKNFADLFKGATAEYEEAQKSLDDAEMRLVSGLNVQLDQLANQADKDKFLSTVWEAIGTPINELDDLQRRGIPMLGEFGDKIEDVMEALRVSGQLDKECNELRSARILYESELKKTAVANKNFVQDLLVVPKTVDGYYNLSDTYSSIITSLANSFKLEDQDFDSAKSFRDFLRKITEGFVNQDPVILDLADLIELRDTIPAEEYASKYREFVSNIASSFGADEETIKVGFSFDPTITDDQVAEIKDTIKQRIGEIQNATDEDLVEYIDTLGISDLKLAYSIQSIGNVSLDDFKKRLDSLKNAASNPIEIKVDASSTIRAFDKVNEVADDLNNIFEDLNDKKVSGISYESLSKINGNSAITGLEGYQEFINTITNSSSTVKEIKAATSELFNEYLYGSGILDNVTEENKDLVASMLKSIGVTNADTIATAAMNAKLIESKIAKWDASNASIDLSNATKTEIDAVASEATQAGITKEQLYLYALQKQLASQATIDTSGDISNLKTLVEVCGIAVDAIEDLQRAKTYYQSELAYQSALDPTSDTYAAAMDASNRNIAYWKSAYEEKMNELSSEIQNKLRKTGEFAPKANYVGNPKNSKSGRSGSNSGSKTEKELIELNKLYQTEVKMAEVEKELENIRRNQELLEIRDPTRNTKYLEDEVNAIRDYKEAVIDAGELDSEWESQEQLISAANTAATKYGKSIEQLVSELEHPSDAFSTQISKEIALIYEEMDALRRQNEILHEQNQIRRNIIREGLDILSRYGFKAQYDAENNYLDIVNYEDAQKLLDAYSKSLGYSIEKQNKAKENVEKWIQTVTEANEANQSNSKTWLDNAKAVEELTAKIRDLNKELFDNFVQKYDDYIGHMMDFGKWNTNDQLAEYKKYLQEIEEWYDRDLISYDDYVQKHNQISQEIYNTQKDSLEEILDMVEEIVKKELDDQVDALEEQKDRYADIVELKKESLRITEEQRKYDDDVDDKARQIAKLQERIDQLSLDDSRAAQAQKADLLEQLYQLQRELAEDQRDHGVELTEEALDKEQEAQENAIDKEIDAIEKMADDASYIHKRVIEYITENWDTLYSKLIDWNSKYGTGIDADVTEPWNNAYAALERYKDMLGEISVEQAALTGVNPITPDKPDSGKDIDRAEVPKLVQQMYKNSQAWDAAKNDPNKRKQLADENASIANDLMDILPGTLERKPDGYWYYNGKKLYDIYTGEINYPTFHTGGEVGIGGEVGKKNRRGNEVFALLKEGENVLTERDSRIASALMRRGLTPISSVQPDTLEGISQNMSTIANILKQQATPRSIGSILRQSTATFAPVLNIEVNTGSGDAQVIAKQTGDEVFDRLTNLFNKSGLGAKFSVLR